MYACPQCSFKIDASLAPLPSRCPRCGTGTAVKAKAPEARPPPPPLPRPETLGAVPPPPPSGRGRASRTLFGMPEIGDTSAPRSPAPPAPPPPPLALDVATGPFDADLPAPVELDLPAPVELDLPAPVGPEPTHGNFGDLDLPAPVGPGFSPLDPDEDRLAPVDDLRMPLEDLPIPVENLPIPVENLPIPVENLPIPVENLPIPVENLPIPATGDDLGLGDLDLDLGLGPAPTPHTPAPTPAPAGERAGLIPRSNDADPRGAVASPSTGDKGPMAYMASPAPKQPEARRSPPKAVVYGGLAALTLCVVVGGAYSVGLFDLNSNTNDSSAQGESARRRTTPKIAPGTIEERSEAILTLLDTDSATAYTEALSNSTTLGDVAGQAEAALLLHLRYGPDPVHLGQAQSLLESLEGHDDGHITRVFALASLAANKPDAAEKQLTASDPRSRLYLAWLKLDQGEYQEALVLAKAVAKERPRNLGAVWAADQAQVRLGGDAGLAKLREDAKNNPLHPLLQQALVRSLLTTGALAEAKKRGQALNTDHKASPEHHASVLALRAEISHQQGDHSGALNLLDKALALAPESLRASVDRFDVLLASGDLSELRPELNTFLRAHPGSRRAMLLRASLEVEAGQGDRALATLSLIKDGNKLAKVRILTGDVHAMRMKIDLARKTYTEARRLDPLQTQSTLNEARLLVHAQQSPAALELLAQEQTTITSDEARANTAQGRRSRSMLQLEVANIQSEEGQDHHALAAVDAALVSDPNNNAALLLRGITLRKLGQHDESDAALVSLHERTGGLPGLTSPVGKVYLRRGQLEKLDALIGRSLKDSHASDELLLTGALLRIREKKTDPAKALVDRVLARTPASREGHLVRTQVLIQQGDYQGALIAIKQAQPGKANAEIELWSGKTLDLNDRSKEAEAHYLRAMQIDANMLEARALYGRALANSGAAKQAIKLLKPVVTATDDYPYAHVGLGRAHHDLGKRELAIADFRRAQAIDASLFDAFYWEGRIQNDRNKHAAAAKALTQATQVARGTEGPSLTDAYRRLGISQKALHRKPQARAAFTRYLELAPPNAAGRRAVMRELGSL